MLTQGLIVYAGDIDGRWVGMGARCTCEDRNREVGREQGIGDSGTEVASGLEMKEISFHHSLLRQMDGNILTPAKATLEMVVVISDEFIVFLDLERN